ncbi:membrane protein [Vibrio variabilis]|uniref:Membrane protein n=1 Tax=Vibrio variabilis TaxID=990271 RepID=A0ABQ0JC80_9VIBR|nr:membrane protein [Vibrio variabilis]
MPWLHRALIAFFSAIIVVALFLPDISELDDRNDRLEIGKHYALSIDSDAFPIGNAAPPTVVLKWEEHTVRSGESAAILFHVLVFLLAYFTILSIPTTILSSSFRVCAPVTS